MRCTSQIPCIGLSLIVSCAIVAGSRAATGGTTSTAASTPSTATTTRRAASTSSALNTSSTTSTSANGARSSDSSLLCAGLLVSGILGEVFTVAPIVPARRGDPNTAIQFGQIWSDAHEATVGTAVAKAPQSKPAVAVVKLPISFSETDRQKFIAAGWTLRTQDGHGASYCLRGTAHGDADPSSVAQGMICVTATAQD